MAVNALGSQQNLERDTVGRWDGRSDDGACTKIDGQGSKSEKEKEGGVLSHSSAAAQPGPSMGVLEHRIPARAREVATGQSERCASFDDISFPPFNSRALPTRSNAYGHHEITSWSTIPYKEDDCRHETHQPPELPPVATDRSRNVSETRSGGNCRASCMAVLHQSLPLARPNLDMNGCPQTSERLTANGGL